ncbi:hypothetical protein [Methylibium petroleiphilum]|uniref:hypothetical protein n=1 Tax=Methylibium petroleiphilum TaxID=105560 RepID=UPI00003CC90D|nr:hypothetical protein [Methylibium petroleiphilum]
MSGTAKSIAIGVAVAVIAALILRRFERQAKPAELGPWQYIDGNGQVRGVRV